MKYFLEKVAVSYPSFFWGGIPAHLSISTVYLGGAEGPPNFGFGRSTRPEAFCNKKLFLEISQNSQVNTCNRVSF